MLLHSIAPMRPRVSWLIRRPQHLEPCALRTCNGDTAHWQRFQPASRAPAAPSGFTCFEFTTAHDIAPHIGRFRRQRTLAETWAIRVSTRRNVSQRSRAGETAHPRCQRVVTDTGPTESVAVKRTRPTLSTAETVRIVATFASHNWIRRVLPQRLWHRAATRF